ncbi:MAG: ParA family protein [Oscillospiraceae bacterium]|nr:ParA family protein [Oscillospiraceae bacterium]
MGKIICVANEKGGVGKTTTAGALAAAFKNKGRRVLAVDMDPQNNLSFSMGAETRVHATVYDMLKGEVKPQFAIQQTSSTDIIASNELLSGLDLDFPGEGREFLLRDALNTLRDRYDYIIIDSPPALGILTVNSFTAADCVLVPMLSDIFSLQGFAQFFETFERVRDSCNPQLYVAGIFLTKFNPRTRLSNEIRQTAAMIAADLEIPLLNTFIHSSVAVSEAQAAQRDYVQYAPKCKAVLDYLALAEELIMRGV